MMTYDCTDMRPLTLDELEQVGGGWFWVALPLFIGGGYTYGKDRAERDNAREESKTCT